MLAALLVAVVGGVGLGAQAAQASTCPAPGGATIADAPAPAGSAFAAYGRGYGHNLGMSQYGAEGAARLGCTAAQILGTYYAGTHVGAAALASTVELVLLNTDVNGNATVTAQAGTVVWVSTSVTPNVTVVQPALTTWTVVRAAVGESVKDSTGKVVLSAPGELRALEAAQAGTANNVARVRTFGGSGGTSLAADLQLKWDYTKFVSGAAGMKIWQVIIPSGGYSGVDKYLWGVAEVPSSWPSAALQAQAIASRTYLAYGYWSATSGAYLIGTTSSSQNYTGYAKQLDATYANWFAAVNATSGQVVLDAAGAMVDSVYTSSHGGRSEDVRYVWGGAGDSYLLPVDDSVWDLASDNPNRSWTKGFSAAGLASALGLTAVSSVTVGAPGTAARLTGVHVAGMSGSTPVSATYTGAQMAAMLGTLSPSMTFAWLNTDVAPPVAQAWAGPGASFRWSATDPAPSSGLAPYAVTITHGTVVDFTGRTASTGMTLVGVPGTTYSLSVVAWDNAGHSSAPVTATATVPLSGTYHPVQPARLVDSRVGQGFQGPLAGHASVTLAVASLGSLVPPLATAVLLNVTATQPASPGYLSVGPAASFATSNLNFAAGQSVATSVMAQLSPSGTVAVSNGSPSGVQVVVDVEGYFTGDTTGGTFVPLSPTRLVDTRYAVGIAAALPAGGGASVQVTGTGGAAGVPTGATAVVVNLTAVAPAQAGFLSAGPGLSTSTSMLNFGVGQTIANLVVAQLSPTGALTLTNGAGTAVDVLVDVQGYVLAGTTGAMYDPVGPMRALDTRHGSGPLPAKASQTLAIAGATGSAVPAGASAVVLSVTAVTPSDVGFLSVGPAASAATSNLNFTSGQTVANLVVAQLSASGTVTVTNGSLMPTDVLVDVVGYFMH